MYNLSIICWDKIFLVSSRKSRHTAHVLHVPASSCPTFLAHHLPANSQTAVRSCPSRESLSPGSPIERSARPFRARTDPGQHRFLAARSTYCARLYFRSRDRPPWSEQPTLAISSAIRRTPSARPCLVVWSCTRSAVRGSKRRATGAAVVHERVWGGSTICMLDWLCPIASQFCAGTTTCPALHRHRPDRHRRCAPGRNEPCANRLARRRPSCGCGLGQWAIAR